MKKKLQITIDFRRIFCRLDSNNQRALEGLNNIERQLTRNKRDSNYYSCVSESSTTPQGINSSDNDVCVESDSDRWTANNSL